MVSLSLPYIHLWSIDLDPASSTLNHQKVGQYYGAIFPLDLLFLADYDDNLYQTFYLY